MELIDKDALVAEIDRLKDKFSGYPTCSNYDYGVKDGRLIGYDEVLYIINSLEVKEVDLNKELNKYFITNNLIAANIQFEPVTQMKKCAQYFFELGLKAQKGE